MTDQITICGSCRPEETETFVAAIRAGLAAQGLGATVGITDCMVVCSKPVTLSMRAQGKAAYLFAGVDPVSQADEVIAFARLYAATPDGLIEDARPCGELRFRLLGRIPA